MDVFKLLSGLSSSISSDSLGSLERASSLYSHQQSRNFAKLAVDSANLVAAVRTGSPILCGTLKGIRSDGIKTALGDDEFENLCADGGLALVAIYYCQRGVEHIKDRFSKDKLEKDSGKPVLSDDVQVIEQMKARAVINHDYLVLELQPGDPQSNKFYISAEKLAVGPAQGKAGIYITYRKSEEKSFLLNENTKLYAINSCGQSLHVPLQAILKTLKEANPDYSLRDANCWDYATTTAKKLALKCAEVAGISATERDRLTRESKDLEATLNRKNMKNIASTVMACGSDRICS